MDEIHMLQPNSADTGETHEVVLTYTPDEPKPVVLCYSAPLPQSAGTQTPPLEESLSAAPPTPPVPPTPPASMRRPRNGPLIFLLSLAVLLIVSACLLFAVRLGRSSADVPDDWEDKFHQYWDSYDESGEGEETTIPAYPIGGDFRLTLTEDRPLVLTAQEIYEQVNPSVVSVVSYLSSGSAGIGTGVIMSEDGYIITNYHVIEGGYECDVILSSGYSYEARLVGYDEENDLAVLKADAIGLTPAVFGSSDLLTVGDKAYAIGNPLGLELRGTLTDGIISAINRDVNVDGYTMSLLQTTAALNSGNSGGALINDHGQVVGITNLKMEGYDSTVEGLGFAIPTTTVKEVVDALIAYGQVENRPTIGITGYTVTAEMAAGFDGPQGVAVQTVREGSDAQMQGILPGDIIVEANGETITTMEQLQALKDSLSVGDVLSLRIWRSGHYLERDVILVDQYTLDE